MSATPDRNRMPESREDRDRRSMAGMFVLLAVLVITPIIGLVITL